MASGSGNPRYSSGAVARARVQVSSARCSRARSEKSEVEVAAERWPNITRRCMRRSCALFSDSISRSRTCVVDESVSTMRRSASVAPRLRTLASRSRANSRSMPMSPSLALRAANGHAIDADRRQPYADRHRLPIFAAGADPFIELQVIPYHRDPGQYVGAVADQRSAFYRARDLPIFDQIGFARREHELAVGDIHLTATEVHRIQAMLDGTNDFFWISLSRQHKGVGHTRHGNMRVALTAAIAGEW